MASNALFKMDPDIARAAAANVFTHCFPLMLTDVVRGHHPMGFHQFRLVSEEAGTLAPGLADNDHRIVLTSAWVDLTDGPVVLHLPHTKGRFCNLTLIDSAGDAFASLGTRTGDDRGLALALVGSGWTGELPNGLRSRQAPGNYVWAVSRIRARSKLDYPEALGVARRQSLASLQGGVDEPRRLMSISELPCPPCLRQVAEMAPTLLFHRLDAILARAPVSFQRTVGPRLSALRAELGGPPRGVEWSPEFNRALARGFADGIGAIRAVAESASSVGRGWRTLPGGADNASAGALARAARAYASLGAPLHEDTLSLACDRDESGWPLSGDHCYRIRFARGALPPVQALWWLSAHPSAPFDQRGGIGASAEPNVNPDGSIELIIQRSPPAAALAPNWLAIPEGRVSLIMRLFGPTPQALTGGWRMPPLERLEGSMRTDGDGGPEVAGRDPTAPHQVAEATPTLPVCRTH